MWRARPSRGAATIPSCPPSKKPFALARTLGDPAHDLAILAEGNTSAREDGATFWVKASGLSMQGIDSAGFVRVRFAPILKAEGLDEEGLLPSVETFMHPWLLTLPGVAVVGHCHPTALLPILCRPDAGEEARRRYFPD